jgi:hypothetical protein
VVVTMISYFDERWLERGAVCWAWGSALSQVLLEAVEDKVESKLVLVAVVVPGLEDVPMVSSARRG